MNLFVPPEELSQTLGATRLVVENGKPASREQHARNRDGAEFVYAVTNFPIRNAAGTIEGVAGIGRDTSERERMERAPIDSREVALAASRAKSEFLSTMSQEIVQRKRVQGPPEQIGLAA